MAASIFAVIVALMCSTAALGQSDNVRHHNFTAAIGAAVPTGSSGTYLGTAPAVTFRYGYRLTRYFQADAGLQLIWGAANNQNSVLTDAGQVQGGDREYMFPLGGRFIIPQPFKRLEFAVGGGAAYLHYSETAPSSAYYQINCYTCSSRGGWGGYGLANASYFLDSNQNFHVGTTFQYVSASTSGSAVGNVAGFHTSDHWANIAVELGLRF